MHVLSLHWFRTQQRTLARYALAAFCLSWLQLAAMPCVMAIGAATPTASAVAAPAMPDGMVAMPDGMVMAPGEHCVYCPPEQSAGGAGAGQDLCAFPQDPQVDSRAALAAAMLAPWPALVLFVVAERTSTLVDPAATLAPPPWRGTSLAVSFCRFLK